MRWPRSSTCSRAIASASSACSRRSKNFESLPLRTRLTDEEVARFAVNRYRFPGVEIKARLFRQYPFGEVASHVIGYIGRINEKDVERIDAWDETANYKGSDYIGKLGVELVLRARAARHHRRRGGRSRRRRPRGAHALAHAADFRQQPAARAGHQAAAGGRGSIRRPPRRAGGDRSLDRRRARVCLQAGLRSQSLRRRHRPRQLGPAQRLARQADAESPAARRLSAGVDHQALPCAGGADLGQAHARPRRSSIPAIYQIAGAAHRFRDDKPGGHGYVDMYQVHRRFLRHVLLHAGQRHRYRRHLCASCRNSALDTRPASTSKASWPVCCRRARGSASASGAGYAKKRKWYLGDSISAGIGQGYNSFTPIQQAAGHRHHRQRRRRIRPHLVKSCRERQGRRRATDRGASRRAPSAVKPEHLAVIKNALVGVATGRHQRQAFRGHDLFQRRQDRHGAGVLTQGRKILAAKIDERLRDHAWYVAYAPADHPRIAWRCWWKTAASARTAAAPIARAVFDYYLLGQRPAQPRLRATLRRIRRRKRLRSGTHRRWISSRTAVQDSGSRWRRMTAICMAGGARHRRHRPHHAVSRHRIRALRASPVRCCRSRFALVLMWIVANVSPQQLARGCAAALCHWRPAADRRGFGGTRRQWIAPLAQPRRCPISAVRADEDRVAADARVVLPETRAPRAVSATSCSPWC